MPDNNIFSHGKITERYCAHTNQNVILRSTSPENNNYECLNAPFCTKKESCARNIKTKG
ncbi:MAG: hypothetical protein IJO74_01925 [Clostridia bacterium]|nr:hypothetical protein [Clostridia bacterium]